MSSPTRPSLSEVLHYSAPADNPEAVERMAWHQRQLLKHFADEVDRVAANNGKTDLEVWQLVKSFNEPNAVAIICLKADGLPLYRKGGWYLDSRDFRAWATAWRPATWKPERRQQQTKPVKGILF